MAFYSIILFILCLTIQCFRSELQPDHQHKDTPIRVSSVGRIAQLGELYSAVTDEFYRITLTKTNKIPEDAIKRTKNSATKLMFTMGSSLEEKFTIVNVSARVKLSVLYGMFTLEGSARYFKDTRTCLKSASATLFESFLTEFHQISITNDEFLPFINHDILRRTNATHVVVGIQYGGNIMANVEDVNTKREEVTRIEGRLYVQMQEVYSASLTGEGKVDISDADKSKLNNFRFTLDADLLPEKNPSNFIEAVEFMKQSPELILKANGGLGKPIEYTLLPLSTLRALWNMDSVNNDFSDRIDDTINTNSVKLFDDYKKAEMYLNDIFAEVDRNQLYFSKDKINYFNSIRFNFSNHQTALQANLRNHLIRVRSGVESPSVLNQLVLKASKSNYSWQSIELMDFTNYTDQVQFIDSLKSEGFNLFDRSQSFASLLLKNFKKDLYIWFYSYSPDIVGDNTFNQFKEMLDNPQIYGNDSVFIAVNYDTLNDKILQTMNKTNRISLYRKGKHLQDLNVNGTTINNERSELKFFSDMKKEIISLKRDVKVNQVQISSIKHNPVPIGFIYPQFPGQLPPDQLYPDTKWLEITANYSGLFFRAEGGGSLPFGQVQSGFTPSKTVEQFYNELGSNADNGCAFGQECQLNPNGWSDFYWTGFAGGLLGVYIKLKSVTKKGEIRPTNMAFRIWIRVG